VSPVNERTAARMSRSRKSAALPVNEAHREAYRAGVGILARREVSEAQVRQRLARKGHDAAAIDSAIARLREEHAIDDIRAAQAIARAETSKRRRGRLRVRLQIEAAGISPAIARGAVDEAFGAIDDDTLIEAALAKRLRGRDRIADDRELQRLYRHLIGQGFEADRVMQALAARRR
jgi:regulatory protein